jgi:hypothetical protein
MDFRMLVESCKIKPVFIQSTDHLSVFLKWQSGVQEKGRGFWKINNSILQELEYLTLINRLIVDESGVRIPIEQVFLLQAQQPSPPLV